MSVTATAREWLLGRPHLARACRTASQLTARLRDRTAKADPLAALTGQERRILELIGEGLTNRQIG